MNLPFVGEYIYIYIYIYIHQSAIVRIPRYQGFEGFDP